jgi:hypothetical protein
VSYGGLWLICRWTSACYKRRWISWWALRFSLSCHLCPSLPLDLSSFQIFRLSILSTVVTFPIVLGVAPTSSGIISQVNNSVYWWWWRPCRWGGSTPLNCAHQMIYYFYPPGVIWAWRVMVSWYRHGKTPDSSLLSISPASSHLVAKQEELTKEMSFALRSISLILRMILL